MKIDKSVQGGVQVLLVDEDRIDASVAIAFKERFRRLVDAVPATVLLDLARVSFIDSSGLGAVVAARKHLGADRSLELAGLQPAVQTVMTLTHMDKVFPIHDSAEAGLRRHGQADAG